MRITNNFHFKIKDYIFYTLLLLLNIIFSFLNSKSAMMGGIMDYYIDFSNIIVNNFDSSFGKMKTPAFPMWGYGWILLISKKRAYLYFIQACFSFFIFISFLKFSRKFKIYNEESLNSFKYLVLLSFSFLSLNFTLSPYSLSINFLIISIIYYISAIHESKVWHIIISAIFYGLLLNFRSDYIYFTLFLPIISILFYRKKILLKLNILWIVVVGLLIMPWILYTYKNVGKAILTSTNSGHVFYIGLGNLPNNKWGITTSDHDLRMYNELKKEFGNNANSLNYNEDIFLKQRFITLIKNEPFEYLKKITYSAIKTIISGIYVPEFYNLRKNCINGCKTEFDFDISNRPIVSLFDSSEKFILYLISYFSILIGVLILFSSYIMLPYVFLKSYKTKNILLFLSCIILLYQLFICSFAYTMRLYSSYSYFWSLLIIVYFIYQIKFLILNESSKYKS